MKIFILLLRLLAAVILVQTLFFKFTGAPESVYIFSRLHAEPVGRYLSGAMELIASILLLLPRTQAFGALLAAGIMSGAILSHIFVLGISVQNDGGLLFGMAVTVLISSLVVMYFTQDQILNLFRKTLRR